MSKSHHALIYLLMATAVAAASLAAASSARAQTWVGTNSTDWFNPGNWSTNAVPIAASSTNINTVTPNPTVVAAPGAVSSLVTIANTAGSTGMLTIESGGTLSNTNQSTVGGFAAGATGTVVVNGGTWNSGTMTVGASNGTTGTITIENGGTVFGSAVSLDRSSIRRGWGPGMRYPLPGTRRATDRERRT